MGPENQAIKVYKGIATRFRFGYSHLADRVLNLDMESLNLFVA